MLYFDEIFKIKSEMRAQNENKNWECARKLFWRNLFFTNSETNTTLTNKQSHFSESDDLDELLTSHPAKKNVMNFMRVIIVDSLSLLSSPKVVTICIRILEFYAKSRETDFYHTMIAFFTQNDLN